MLNAVLDRTGFLRLDRTVAHLHHQSKPSGSINRSANANILSMTLNLDKTCSLLNAVPQLHDLSCPQCWSNNPLPAV